MDDFLLNILLGCNPEDTRNAPSLDENKKSIVS